MSDTRDTLRGNTYGPIDKPRIEAAMREFLIAIGEDPDREGLVDTPNRVASFPSILTSTFS